MEGNTFLAVGGGCKVLVQARVAAARPVSRRALVAGCSVANNGQSSFALLAEVLPGIVEGLAPTRKTM